MTQTATVYPPITDLSRNAVTARIKAALKARSGINWSVTGGKGTAWGWIKIDAPKARLTCACGASDRYEATCKHEWKSYVSKYDQRLLRRLLGFDEDSGYPVGWQGVDIPSGSDYYEEYIDRAEGRTPRRCGRQYWD